MSRSNDLKSYVCGLIRLLSDLNGGYRELLDLLAARREAIVRADLAAMSEINHAMAGLTEQLRERAGLRRQLTDAMGRCLGLAPVQTRRMSLAELIQKSALPEETAASLRAAGDALRETMSRVIKANEELAAVTGDVLARLHVVLASVTRGEDSCSGYTHEARPATSTGGAGPMLFDFVG